jgi:hypothetical protein
MNGPFTEHALNEQLDIRVFGESGISIGNDCHAADHRVINARRVEFGQQPFERGNNLPRG